ncbi:MAG: hypothetical protein AW09_003973 [Candidatus Accumulibacter phosphatis]|uniref:Uncharacterized protein n=1 Tax=Candidatus Accumulibacter phosphatis TaxID=327160 RepID=A0A080M126_9PROT|nr:MAG: hypothetical protein AW09_003973 [Candidatus Accumulibacter phosphatis]
MPDEILFQFFGPAAHDARHLPFDRVGIVAVVGTDRRTGDEMQTCQPRLAEHDKIVDALGGEAFMKERRDALADGGVETVARHIDDRRNITPPGVVAQEDAYLLALMQ